MTGVTSTPMPSPSMNGMTGRSGTRSDPSALIEMRSPPCGGSMCSYCIAEPGGGRQIGALSHALCLLFPQAPGDQHRDLHRLIVVQARVDLRLVRAREIGLRQTARAAGAFRDVSTGELEMHAAQHASHLAVDPERRAQLLADVLEPASLVPVGRRLGVAVHRIADPEHLRSGAPDGLDHARQVLLDVLHTEA